MKLTINLLFNLFAILFEGSHSIHKISDSTSENLCHGCPRFAQIGSTFLTRVEGEPDLQFTSADSLPDLYVQRKTQSKAGFRTRKTREKQKRTRKTAI